jgi:hypothetical protein
VDGIDPSGLFDINIGGFDFTNEGVASGLVVGASAVGSAVTGGLWNGGNARNDVSFKTSLAFAKVGVTAGTMALGGWAPGAIKGALAAKKALDAAKVAETAVDDSVTLYRAVGPEEAGDINATGTVRLGPSGEEGKWFAENVDDAVTWGQQLYSGQEVNIVAVHFPTDVVEGMYQIERLDAIGSARFALENDLKSVIDYIFLDR